MKIENKIVEEFATFLLSMKLKGYENRMRNRFVKLLQNHLKQMQEEHKLLLDDYCKKDEKGEYKTINKDGKSYYDIDDVEGFQQEFEKLMEESLVIMNDESNREMIDSVKGIVLNIDREFSGSEALKYEAYCEVFEQDDDVEKIEDVVVEVI